MSASLVGSEMCIRDRSQDPAPTSHQTTWMSVAASASRACNSAFVSASSGSGCGMSALLNAAADAR
eukprot:957341-Alexandrium_andersonii.AAC.1